MDNRGFEVPSSISVENACNLQIAVKSKLLGVERRDFLWFQVVFHSF